MNKDYKDLDEIYIPMDKDQIRRTNNIQLIPKARHRLGGKVSYAEWAHTIGIFQTLFCQNLDCLVDNMVLDVGCGTGIMGIASYPFILDQGHYLGIDALKMNIHICRETYPSEYFSFIHPDRRSSEGRLLWDVEDSSFDLITALSVWSHLDEESAIYYFKEVARLLKPKGKAIITFFLLDGIYAATLPRRTTAIGRYHSTYQEKWFFDKSVGKTGFWFCPNWAEDPNQAVGITKNGLDLMLKEARDLYIIEKHHGNWKEVPGMFFQDVIIFGNKQVWR